MSNDYSQKLRGSAKRFETDAINTASKRAIEETAEATGNLNGHKIADKIKNIKKNPTKEAPSKELHLNETNNETRIKI